jgi:hypothetical protein
MSSEIIEMVGLSCKRATIHWIQRKERQLGLGRGNTGVKTLNGLGHRDRSLSVRCEDASDSID